MPLSRRAFLQQASGVVLGCIAGFCLPPAFAAEAQGRKMIVGTPTSICRVDLTSLNIEQIPLSFQAHSFLQNPQDPNRIWAVEAWGHTAAEVDFGSNQVLRVIRSKDHESFFGHGVFGTDRQTFFVSRVDLDTGEGYLTGFAQKGDERVADYKVTPGFLHECRITPEGHVLIASSGIKTAYGLKPREGTRIAASSLIRFDPQSGKRISEATISGDEVFINHFNVAKDGTIVATTATRPSAEHDRPCHIYFSRDGGESLRRVELPPELASRMVRETLSIAINDAEHLAAVTNPAGGMVLLIDLKKGALADVIEIESPQGIVYDAGADRFYVDTDGIERLDIRNKNHTMLTGMGPDHVLLSSAHALLV